MPLKEQWGTSDNEVAGLGKLRVTARSRDQHSEDNDFPFLSFFTAGAEGKACCTPTFPWGVPFFSVLSFRFSLSRLRLPVSDSGGSSYRHPRRLARWHF